MAQQTAQTQQSAVEQIIAFARHIGRADDTTPEDRVQRRDWLDADGKPTEAGLDLLAALNDQGTTRTVFRSNF